MSHFLTVVLIPKETEDIEGKIEEMLNPYNENLEVEGYDEECSCVGSEANREGKKAVNFKARMDEKQNDPEYKSLEFEERDKVWKEFIEILRSEAKPFIESHPLFEKPDPKCDECKGTGIYKSTYNPKSEWDWYTVGGRWDGWVHGPMIQKLCVDKEDGGFNWGDKHHTLGSNLCPVKNMPFGDYEHMPFAIVTPDGEWHSKEWNYTDEENDNWQLVARKIIEDNIDCIAVAIDCHI